MRDGRALTEVSKPFADQGQREGAAAKVDVRSHPFDWWDLLLFAMPIATIVFAMFWGGCAALHAVTRGRPHHGVA